MIYVPQKKLFEVTNSLSKKTGRKTWYAPLTGKSSSAAGGRAQKSSDMTSSRSLVLMLKCTDVTVEESKIRNNATRNRDAIVNARREILPRD
ncbi:predicted protein [Sclerotinia sclerotiorum 1980 UF-70]|uniref:Uncharacterized protein n=1 Tax=Sclerotinia sclerotiorum (strain ATCC 18683 / 1980 / Ss-1) TaxID=665079 RepID=A7F1A7_SCLS1|nr:predicted protein [Sclerotinia sclerotiorum 1980 UF-70]EDN95499.1 predicted protein [Sclerotinia sclerotiorum 1980 UF-70]